MRTCGFTFAVINELLNLWPGAERLLRMDRPAGCAVCARFSRFVLDYGFQACNNLHEMEGNGTRTFHSIRDIAKDAGVSIATVSRYLNHPETVSPKTGETISRTIKKLGYVPNALAQGVFHNEIKVLGLVIPSVADSYFNYMAKLIETSASQYGYATILCNTDDQYEKEREHIELLQRLRVSGIIAIRPRHSEAYKNLICPVVSYEKPIGRDVLNIAVNDLESGKQAFEHLYARGSRHFLMIKGPTHLTGSENRYQGFFHAANRMGCNISVCELPTDYHFFMEGHYLDEYLERPEIDGIFAYSDMIAAVTLYWLQSHGRSVPEDVRLIGFDDNDICNILRPKLTTFKQPGEKICKLLVDSLIEIIRGTKKNEGEIIVDSQLVVREST